MPGVTALPDFFVVRRGPESRVRDPFTHENVGHEVTWVESGGIDFTIGGRVLSARAGAAVLVPPAIENTPSGPGGAERPKCKSSQPGKPSATIPSTW